MRVLGQFRIVEHPGGKVPVEPHDDGGAAPGGGTAEAAGQPEAEQTPSVPAQDRRPGDEPPAAPTDGHPTGGAPTDGDPAEAPPDAGTDGVDGSATAEPDSDPEPVPGWLGGATVAPARPLPPGGELPPGEEPPATAAAVQPAPAEQAGGFGRGLGRCVRRWGRSGLRLDPEVPGPRLPAPRWSGS